jgi:hypothetical protein
MLNLHIFGICKSVIEGIKSGKELDDIQCEIEARPKMMLSAPAGSVDLSRFKVNLQSIPVTNLAHYDTETSVVHIETSVVHIRLTVADVTSVHELVFDILKGGRRSRVHVMGSDDPTINERSRAIALETCKVLLFGDFKYP